MIAEDSSNLVREQEEQSWVRENSTGGKSLGQGSGKRKWLILPFDEGFLEFNKAIFISSPWRLCFMVPINH